MYARLQQATRREADATSPTAAAAVDNDGYEVPVIPVAPAAGDYEGYEIPIPSEIAPPLPTRVQAYENILAV